MNLENFASRGLKAQAAVDELLKINDSKDVTWLRSMMTADYQLSIRSAAQRRLRMLAKQPSRTLLPATRSK